jgi:hypothetical protein
MNYHQQRNPERVSDWLATVANADNWSLELGGCLDVGAWNLELSYG